MKQMKQYDGITNPETQPWKDMTTRGNDYTSHSTMMTRVTNMLFPSPKLECVCRIHATQYIAKMIKKVTERINHTQDTLSTEHTHQTFTETSRYFVVCVQHLWAIPHYADKEILYIISHYWTVYRVYCCSLCLVLICTVKKLCHHWFR